ncbi:MAG: hypothetical protein AAGK02_02815, partial [Pseudomonadota bacterium]
SRDWPIIRYIPDGDAAYGRVFEVLGMLFHVGLTHGDQFCFSGMAEHRNFARTTPSSLDLMASTITFSLPMEESLCNPRIEPPPPTTGDQ